MSFIDKLEELFKSEEFIKSYDKKSTKDLLSHTMVLKNPNATKEEKIEAVRQLQGIMGGKRHKSGASPQRVKDDIGKLSDAAKIAQQKMTDVNKEKIAQNIQQAKSNVKRQKEEVATERHKEKQAKRQAELLPGSEYTQAELQSQVDRSTKDPNDWKPKEIKSKKPLSPEVQANVIRNKASSAVNGAIDLAHQLHSSGNSDDAHKLLSAIPREHMPQELKDYNPVYIHYGVTPKLWKTLPPGDRQGAHEYHNEVMTGVHDKHPDPAIQTMIQRVKQAAPKPSA